MWLLSGEVPEWGREIIRHWATTAREYASKLTELYGFSPFITKFEKGREVIDDEKRERFEEYFQHSEEYRLYVVTEEQGEQLPMSTVLCLFVSC